MARLYAVHVLCHYHSSHHIEHLQFPIAGDDEVVAALIGENIGVLGALRVLESNFKSRLAIGRRTDEGVRWVLVQIDFCFF